MQHVVLTEVNNRPNSPELRTMSNLGKQIIGKSGAMWEKGGGKDVPLNITGLTAEITQHNQFTTSDLFALINIVCNRCLYRNRNAKGQRRKFNFAEFRTTNVDQALKLYLKDIKRNREYALRYYGFYRHLDLFFTTPEDLSREQTRQKEIAEGGYEFSRPLSPSGRPSSPSAKKSVAGGSAPGTAEGRPGTAASVSSNVRSLVFTPTPASGHDPNRVLPQLPGNIWGGLMWGVGNKGEKRHAGFSPQEGKERPWPLAQGRSGNPASRDGRPGTSGASMDMYRRDLKNSTVTRSPIGKRAPSRAGSATSFVSAGRPDTAPAVFTLNLGTNKNNENLVPHTFGRNIDTNWFILDDIFECLVEKTCQAFSPNFRKIWGDFLSEAQIRAQEQKQQEVIDEQKALIDEAYAMGGRAGTEKAKQHQDGCQWGKTCSCPHYLIPNEKTVKDTNPKWIYDLRMGVAICASLGGSLEVYELVDPLRYLKRDSLFDGKGMEARDHAILAAAAAIGGNYEILQRALPAFLAYKEKIKVIIAACLGGSEACYDVIPAQMLCDYVDQVKICAAAKIGGNIEIYKKAVAECYLMDNDAKMLGEIPDDFIIQPHIPISTSASVLKLERHRSRPGTRQSQSPSAMPSLGAARPKSVGSIAPTKNDPLPIDCAPLAWGLNSTNRTWRWNCADTAGFVGQRASPESRGTDIKFFKSSSFWTLQTEDEFEGGFQQIGKLRPGTNPTASMRPGTVGSGRLRPMTSQDNLGKPEWVTNF